MIDINEAKKIFNEFVKKYDTNNEMIDTKYNHTFRVCENSLNICKSMNLNEEDTNLAYIIALLHDLGRFEQAKKYKTFNDSKSIDHANYACKILFDDNLIRKFIKTKEYDLIIKKSIYNHNKYEILDECNEKELLHIKIIRDADKLDILNEVINKDFIKIKDTNDDISDEVRDEFKLNKPINIKKTKNKNDLVLVRFAFVFDLNFKYSYRVIKEKNYVNRMYNLLNYKDIFKKYVDIANDYVERMC